MSYADSLLSTGERVVHRDKQHWFVLVWDARYSILAIAIGVGLAVVKEQATPPVSDALNVLAIVLIIGGLLVIAWSVLDFLNHEYVLTNRRVIEVEGVLNKRSADSSLEKINDAILVQTLLGRIFGFGDLEVLTASEAGISEFRMLIDPIKFKRKMLDAKHEYEVDLAGGFVGGPPLRSGPSAGSAARPQPGPAPAVADLPSEAAAVPPGEPVDAAGPVGTAGSVGDDTRAVRTADLTPGPMSSDELTRTLTSLADLRDRGAISEDEYERKKTDLLSRL
jgi:hypothetical protein